MRSTYWSCTKFADAIRGTPKPHVLEMEEWNSWHLAAKTSHPYRYWIAETLLDSIQDVINFIPDKITDVLYYINNRWVTKSHYMKTGLNPGEWYDYDSRIINALFNELIDFVEIECAWHNVCWDKQQRNIYSVPWWTRHRIYRNWRSSESGIAYLNWSSNLVCDSEQGYDESHPDYMKPTEQAKGAMKIKALYHWWKVTRPGRPDIYDVTGWSAYCELNPSLFSNDKTEEERQHTKEMLDKIRNLETMYDEEDTQMLVELIKIRHHLWT